MEKYQLEDVVIAPALILERALACSEVAFNDELPMSDRSYAHMLMCDWLDARDILDRKLVVNQ